MVLCFTTQQCATWDCFSCELGEASWLNFMSPTTIYFRGGLALFLSCSQPIWTQQCSAPLCWQLWIHRGCLGCILALKAGKIWLWQPPVTHQGVGSATYWSEQESCLMVGAQLESRIRNMVGRQTNGQSQERYGVMVRARSHGLEPRLGEEACPAQLRAWNTLSGNCAAIVTMLK